MDIGDDVNASIEKVSTSDSNTPGGNEYLAGLLFSYCYYVDHVHVTVCLLDYSL